eukprot:GHVP01032552.1.p1 GENE.GHVP01032552.1~~GHVP01032552.1.p1  ORF type:complete len:182 (-),score=23.80 GHVP01032552.1:32-577(-)
MNFPNKSHFDFDIFLIAYPNSEFIQNFLRGDQEAIVAFTVSKESHDEVKDFKEWVQKFENQVSNFEPGCEIKKLLSTDLGGEYTPWFRTGLGGYTQNNDLHVYSVPISILGTHKPKGHWYNKDTFDKNPLKELPNEATLTVARKPYISQKRKYKKQRVEPLVVKNSWKSSDGFTPIFELLG